MTIAWKPNEFKIAVNMAGAVSAGAYTAGVLDFLMEALEEWQKAKDAFRRYIANHTATSDFAAPVPLHDVSIEAFSGASAGGMCAAIASVMVQGSFDHINDAAATNTNNTFYEAWVNQIDISKLLSVEDLKSGRPLVSLLDSTIVDTIARSALNPGIPSPQPYISKSLTLFLTLTNVRGVPYQMYADPSPTLNEFITYYATRCDSKPSNRAERQAVHSQNRFWSTKVGCMGFAAKRSESYRCIYLFLAPRKLIRDLIDYGVPNWMPICGPPPSPSISSDLPTAPTVSIATLNIDGGVTDNDPFDLAHDFLASQNPKAVNGTNPRGPLDANCAVISVAHFLSADRFNPQYDFAEAQGMLPIFEG